MSKIDILHKTCLFLVKRLGDFYMTEKMDRRVRKTKAQLREGLARLMQITEVMQNHPIDPGNPDSVLPFIVQFFSIMDKDRDLCLALLGPHGDMAFVEQIENLLAETFLKQLPDRFPKNDPDIKYPYAFILNGCVGLIRTWLSSPQSESPEQVARLTYHLIENTIQGYLNMKK